MIAINKIKQENIVSFNERENISLEASEVT